MMDIENLISRMTLEEKASLLSGDDFWHTKAVSRLGIERTMVSDGPHGLRKQDQEADHLGINDSIKAVCFPAACAAAASFDTDLLYTVGEALGDTCQHEEVSVILGPAVNIKRSPLCGRNFEYFSEDPYLAGEMASALIKGVQSRGVGTSIKHFAANSQEHRRMSNDVVADERTLREIYFPAFEKAVKEAEPWTVMCSYNRINGTYASENRWLLTDVLRDEWGFDGYVMSDWGAVSDRVAALRAGLDLEMPSSNGVNDVRIVDAVRNGTLSEETVNESVRRILRIMDRYLEERRPDTPWDKQVQHRLAADAAAQCMVLLKNEGQVLPLDAREKVAVIGDFARRARIQGGGSSHINCWKVENLLDVLEKENYSFARGYRTEDARPDEQLIEEAVQSAAQADKAVIVAGLPDSFESEGYDRTHMRLPACQDELISRVAAANPNTIVVLYNGSPVEMPWADQVKGIVEGYLLGQGAGRATKAILWGEVNPSGRLPESFPLKLEHNPSYLTYGGEGDRCVYSEGVFVGYRYYDRKQMDVLFPFGYGLSYTTFEYSDLRLDSAKIKDTDTLAVHVDVTNTGTRAGREVVQLYVSAPAGRVFRPERELKGFAKVYLEPGETKTVTLQLDRRAFAYWEERLHDWYVPAGSYGICIGKNSREMVLCEEVEVVSTCADPFDEPLTTNTIMMDIMDKEPVMEDLEDILQTCSFFQEKQEKEATQAAKEAITDEMNNAMKRYLPLRGLIGFGDGTVTYEQICERVDKINRKLRG